MKTFKEIISEALDIYDDNNKKIETRKLKFTKRNIEKIASDYDAIVNKIEIDIGFASLKDSKGRLIIIQQK